MRQRERVSPLQSCLLRLWPSGGSLERLGAIWGEVERGREQLDPLSAYLSTGSPEAPSVTSQRQSRDMQRGASRKQTPLKYNCPQITSPCPQYALCSLYKNRFYSNKINPQSHIIKHKHYKTLKQNISAKQISSFAS